MFDVLDRQTTLTGNQKKIIGAAIIGDALEFFDYFLISYVLAFVIGPWKLTFGQSAIVLLSSGVGAIIGAYVWGWIADRIGRRKVFIGTVLNFSIATGLLYFTPDNGWIYLTVMRFFVGCRRRRPLLRRPAAGPGVHADLQARLGRRTGHRRHPARRRPRRRAGRLHAERPVAPAVRHWPAARAGRPAGAAVGPRIAALAGAAGPLRGGAQVARLGAAGPARIAALAAPRRGRTPRPSRPTGSTCSSIRAACWCRGWAMPARRPAPMAWHFGRRRCSCCC